MLGFSPLPRTAEAALRDAEHPQPTVRLSALLDLGRHARAAERERAILAIIALLRSDPSPDIRAEAAVVLADAEAKGARTALLAALDDPAERVRQMALLALGELGEPGDRELGERLLAAGDAPEPALRFQALIACERLLPERAEELVARALGDQDDEVRAMALRLARQRWPNADGPETLLELGRRALSDSASRVRAAAALWLAPRREPLAERVLVDVVNGSVPLDAGPDLGEALELVGTLGLTEARPALERRAFGLLGRTSALGWHARIALARLGDARARRAIVKGLAAWTRDARTLAVVAAGRAGVAEARDGIARLRGDTRRAEPEAVEEALAALAAAPRAGD
jgi:HEAT repeat protein